MENKTNLRRSVRPERRERFSIRKFNVGVASVAVAAFFMAGGSSVAATELSGTGTTEATTVAGGETTGETSPETTDAAEEAEPAPAVEVAPAAPQAEEAKAEEAPVAEVAPEAPKAEEAPKTEETPSAEVKAEETPKADAQPAEPVTPTITTRVATEEAPVVAAPVRTAATTYRVQYVDAETGERLKQENRSVSQETTNAKEEPVTFKVDIKLDAPTGYKAETASNNAGTEFAIVNNAIAAAIVEGNTASRTIKVLVRKDAAAASNNNTEGRTGFRAEATTTVANGNITATGKIENIVARADGGVDSTQTIELNLKDGAFQPGDIITLTFENISGIGYKPGDQLTDSRGNVIAVVRSEKSVGTYSYDAQRTAATTHEQKVAANLPADPQDVVYEIELTDRILTNNSTVIAAKFTGGTRAPQVGVNTPVTARILVNGEPIVSEGYVIPRSDQADIRSTRPPYAELRGNVHKTEIRDFDTDALLKEEFDFYRGRSQKDDDIFYFEAQGDLVTKGSRIEVKLNDTNFATFRQSGEFKEVTVALSAVKTEQNMQYNENNVWLWPDNGNPTAKIKAVSVTDDTLVIEITDGEIQPNQVIRFGGQYLEGMGVDREFKGWDAEQAFANPENTQFHSTINYKVFTPEGNQAAVGVGGNRWNIHREIIRRKNADNANLASAVVTRYFKEGTDIQIEPSRFTKYDGVVNTHDKAPGAPYDVTGENVLEEIVFEGITYVRTATPPSNLTGILADKTTFVDYTYAPKPGAAVTVDYVGVSSTGEETLRPQVVIQPAGTPVGTDYAITRDQKPTVLTNQDGVVFVLTATRPSSSAERGDVLTTPQPITFVYTPIQNAIINFVEVESKEPNAAVVKPLGDALTSESQPNDTRLPGKAINLSTAERIQEYLNQGYELVSDEFTDGGAKVYDDVKENPGTASQVYTVKLTPKKVVIDPEKPENPPVPAGVTLEAQTDTVTRNITYTYKDGNKAGQEAAPKQTETVEFTRVATINAVTKEVTYTDWKVKGSDNQPTKLLPLVTSPDRTSVFYDAERTAVPAVTVRALENNTPNRIINEKVEYLAQKGGAVKVAYETDLGEKLKGGATTEVKPAGTQVGETYNTTAPATKLPMISEFGIDFLLTGVKENSAPENGSVAKDEQVITYIYKAIQAANVRFVEVDKAGTEVKELSKLTTEEQAKDDKRLPGQPITFDRPVAEVIADLVKQGYEVVANDVPGTPTYDNTKDNKGNPSQAFTVKVTPRIIQTPNPQDPEIPAGVKVDALTEEVSRTIMYKFDNAEGPEAAPTKVQEPVTFTREVIINLVEALKDPANYTPTYTDWSADQTLPAVTSPTATNKADLAGYTADKPVVEALTVKATDEDPTVTVVYTKDPQKATISFKTDATAKEPNKDLGSVAEEGLTKDPISEKAYMDKLAELEKLGYDVKAPAKDEFASSDKTFDTDTQNDQTFEVVVKERIVPVTADAKPGQPFEPGNENSPVWPNSLESLTKTEDVTRTIVYVYEDNTTAAETKTEKVTFTREATVNLVTGEIVYGPWTEDKTFPEVTSPTIKGFTPGTEVVPAATVKATDANIDVKVVYTKDSQLATILFETNTGTQLAIIDEAGLSNEPISEVAYKAKLVELEKAGYQVNPPQSDNFVGGKTFDDDKNEKQNFTVVVAPRVLEVPKDAVPGQPVDPNNPNSPVWPESIKDLKFEEMVTRTITYINNEGETVSADVTETLTFTRTATVNLVTGDVVYGDWTSADDKFDAVKSPVIPGYLTETAQVPASTEPVAATAEDSKVVVEYTPIGKYIINVPGETPITEVYPNHPTDPTKPGEPKTVVPFVPGYTPTDADDKPLKPVDPTDPTKGYEVPALPTDPAVDTPIVYVKDDQKATITFKTDETAKEPNKELGTVNETGKSDEPISADAYKAKLVELEKAGYEVNPPLKDEFKGDKNFDNDKDNPQNFDVVVKERIVPVTKDNTPGTPVDPKNPNSPVYPTPSEEIVTEKTVTRTITYTYLTPTGETASATVEQPVSFTRTATVNLVTGQVEFGAWSEDKLVPAVDSPVIKGFLADRATVGEATISNTTESYTENVVYKPLGQYVVKVPGQDQPTTETYPNNPTDPTKPGEPKTVVPFVPGFTPVDGSNNPLKPVNPADPTEGYVVPAIPADPSVDTPIVYVQDGQTATIVFKSDETAKEPNKELGTVNETGKSGEKISADAYKAKLVELEKAGYDVKTPAKDEFAGDKNFDNDKDTPQTFEVVLKEIVIEVPKDAVPGQPVDSNNPNSPVWPSTVEGLVKEEMVTRTIKYIDGEGKEVSTTVTETLSFTRPATVNLVTGEVVYGAWTSADDKFDAVKSPVIPGYLTSVSEVPSATAKATDKDSEVLVVYRPLGSYIINVPGKTPITDVYPNNPTDPTKPGTPTTVVPFVPGFTPVDGKNQPLKPVDPTDPTKGYEVPALPTDPSVDTPITYLSNPQVATIAYVDDKGTELVKDEVLGKAGDKIAYTTADRIKELHAKGYEVVTDNFDQAAIYDNIDGNVQEFKVVVTPRIIPVTETAVPGQPVDSTDPNSPVWPAGVDTLETVKDITRTITYVNDMGETVSATVTEKVTFTRDAKVNLVTGEIMYGEWTSADNMFDTVKSPVIPGYLADTASVPGSTATPTDGNSSVVVTYKPIGKYIINVPGKDPINEVYPNNPEDPTKPGNPTTVAPHVPGFTPVDGNGQPLKPVDPTDPTKGYVVPAIPTDPSVDTPITYLPVPSVPSTPVPTTPETKEKHQVIVRYHDTNGKVIKAEVVDTETTMTGLPYDTTDNRPAEIVKDGVHYVLVPELTQGQEEGVVTAGVTYVTYVYKAVVETPAKPEMPMTPAKPAPAPMAPVQPAAPAQAAAKAPVAQAMPMLPETGDDNSVAALAGTVLLASAMGMAATRRRKED